MGVRVYSIVASYLWLAVCAHAELILSGRVVDETDAPVGNARVTVRPRLSPGAQSIETVTDSTGAFRAPLAAPGVYNVEVRREGYYELRNQEIAVESSHEITFVLSPVREVFQSMDVSERPSPVDPAQPNREERLTGTEINDIPYPASHSLRNAMRLIPGTVQDPSGAVHFTGGAEYQTLYTLNGFDISDPVTGRLRTRLSVEAVRSMEYSTGRYSPEFGKGSAGVLAINTDTGTDRLRYTATNFVPGIDTNQGVHLGGWKPRVGLSGPIWKGRAWFADSFDFEYDNAYLNGLPKGQNDRTGWTASNLLHNQVNFTPSNILFADFLVNIDHQNHVGLGALDPISTTKTQRNDEYFWSLKDQIYSGEGLLIEIGAAQNRFASRDTPQGTLPYRISPEGRSGNYFANSVQHSRRDQLLANAFLPHFQAWGEHQIKAGTGLDRLHYAADFQRTSYQRIGFAGELVSQTVFLGSGRYQRPNLEAFSYVLDDWRIRKNLTVEFGVRQDWDELVRQIGVSPRVSTAWSPDFAGGTRISAGYAVTYDSSPLALFGQALDQQSITYFFNPDGTPDGPPLAAVFRIPYGHLKMPRYTNWSAGLDRPLPHRIYVSLDLLRRRGDDAFTYVPDGTAYTLGNLRRDRYDSVQVGVRQTLKKQYEWSATYTRSRAISNAVLDISVDQVMRVQQNFGAMPWDAPHRFLGLAYLPLPRKNWAIAVMADARSGFPFSAQDVTGRVVGAVDAFRYPFNFELNVHLERMFRFRGYRFALRGGFNNLTNSRNPTAVNNVIGSPQYLQFFGNQGRHFQVRIRFFGRG